MKLSKDKLMLRQIVIAAGRQQVPVQIFMGARKHLQRTIKLGRYEMNRISPRRPIVVGGMPDACRKHEAVVISVARYRRSGAGRAA